MKTKTITFYQSTCYHYLFSAFYRGEWLGDVTSGEGLEEFARAKGATHYKINRFMPALQQEAITRHKVKR